MKSQNTQLHNISIITNSNPPKHIKKMIISNLSISLQSFMKTKNDVGNESKNLVYLSETNITISKHVSEFQEQVESV